MYKKILVVVGREPTSKIAVREGVALAKVHDAELLFVVVLPRFVVPVMEMEMPTLGIRELGVEEFQRNARSEAARLLATATAVASKVGVRSEATIDAGSDDAQCIVDTARERRCGLIVVASAGRNALTRLLAGSVIPGLITHSTVPVLVCRQASAEREPTQSTVVPLTPSAQARKRSRAAA